MFLLTAGVRDCTTESAKALKLIIPNLSVGRVSLSCFVTWDTILSTVCINNCC